MVLAPRNRPLLCKQAVEAISHQSRIEVIRLLLESGREGLSPSGLTEKMNLKIPTVMSRLEILEKTGVVRFELRRMLGGDP